MRFRKLLFSSLFILIPLLFFYKTVVFGLIPFPGDLLVGNYEPYKSEVPGIPHKGQGGDVIRELYPWKYFSVESIKNGVFPLWNPYVFSGTPHFASLQSGTLYPANIIFFVLPFVDAWTAYIILQYVLLMVFTYLYLRQIGLQRVSGLFGSIAFTFCSFMTVWGEYGNIGHSLVYLPLALLAIEKILTKSRWYWFLLLVFAFVCSTFAGYIQLTMYIYVFSAIYVVSKFLFSKTKLLKTYILIIGCFIFGILLSAVQLLPLYELVGLSLRGNYSYMELLDRLLPVESFITFMVPDFFGNPATNNYFLKGGSILERSLYVGLLVFIFAIFSFFSKKNFYTIFFGVLGLVIFITCISVSPVAYLHNIGLPFLSTGIPTRVLSIFSFCLCVLGAIGFDNFFYKKEKKLKLIILLCIVGLIFTVFWVATFLIPDPNLSVSRRNLIIPTGLLFLGIFFIALRIKKSLIAVVILTLLVFELFYSFQKFNSFVPRSYIYPKSEITQKLREIQGIDRVWGYGSANIDSEFQIIEKNYGTDGYNPLFSKTYGEFISASGNGLVKENPPRTVANIKSGYGVNELKQNYYRRRTLDLAGARYLLNKKNDVGIDSAFDEVDYKLIWQHDGWQIYESLHYLPRIKMFGNYEVISDKKDTIKRLYDPEFDIQKSIILDNELMEFETSATSSGNAKVVSYTPQRIEIETSSDGNQLLFISDNHFPGWAAYVNGIETPILRANYTFRAVPVQSGNQNVVFSYEPDSFKIGVTISIISLGGLILVVLFGTLVQGHVHKNKKK